MVIKSQLLRFLLFCAGVLLLNVLAQYAYFRFDFTKEKRYTLTSRTADVLGAAKKEITITVFLDGEMPAAFKRLKKATADLLSDYQRLAKVPVKLIYIDPIEGLNGEEQDKVITDLSEIGIKPVAINLKTDAGVTQKVIFPMALIEVDGRPMAVNLLQKSGGPAVNYEENITYSIQNLEYTFTSAIHRLMSGQYPRIGFTEGNGEPDNIEIYDAINSLSQSFYVGRVDLKLINKQGLDSLAVLVVANPKTALSEAEKYKINYFVMKGGKVVWLIDQVRANLDDLQDGAPKMVTANNLNLDDMLFGYGVRINYDLIADLNAAMIPVSTGALGQGQIQLFPWFYYPILLPDSTHQLVRNLDGIRTEFASSVDTIAVPGILKRIILRTSPYHKVDEVPRMLSLQQLQEQPDPKVYLHKPRIGGVLLEGQFKSTFVNRPVPDGIAEDYRVPELGRPTKMIVIGDGSIFSNQVSKNDQSPYPLGFDRYSQLNYGNKALLLNVADYLTDERHLIDLRNKDVKVRLLDKVKLKVEKTRWQVIHIFFPVFLLILLATFQHYYRRRKYAK